MDKTWEEELEERFLKEGEGRGEARGEAKGEASGLRFALRTLLLQRFQTLPEEVLQRIASANADRLKAALASVLTVKSLDELTL